MTTDNNMITIDNAGFSVSTYNCLRRANILSLRDIVGMTRGELLQVRNLGKKNLDEIIDKLKEYNMTLKNEVDIDAEYEEFCKAESEAQDKEEALKRTERGMEFQIVMRDTHGQIETDTWGMVSNSETFDSEGNPVEGGLYDPYIFGNYKVFFSLPTNEQVSGVIGTMELALPVVYPRRPNEIIEDRWVHMTIMPILPPIFRGMSHDKKIVSDIANLWNNLVELNFAIPNLLEKEPDRRMELQAKLQAAVDAIYEWTDNLPYSDETSNVTMLVYQAMRPIDIVEEYGELSTLMAEMRTLIEKSKDCDKRADYAAYLGDVSNLAYAVGYNNDELQEYSDFAEKVIESFGELE